MNDVLLQLRIDLITARLVVVRQFLVSHIRHRVLPPGQIVVTSRKRTGQHLMVVGEHEETGLVECAVLGEDGKARSNRFFRREELTDVA